MGEILYIGIKKGRFIDSILSKSHPEVDFDKLLYKYYRTPERVEKLIKTGGTRGALGIYLSPSEQEPGSELYNEEVNMLPFNIGYPDSGFPYYSGLKEDDPHSITTHYSEEEFYTQYDFTENSTNPRYKEMTFKIYLYDSDTKEWLVGKEKTSLRNAIIDNFNKTARKTYITDDRIDAARMKLLQEMDDIDKFIAEREAGKYDFIADSDVLDKVKESGVLAKLNELDRLLAKHGIKVTGCSFGNVEKNKHV